MREKKPFISGREWQAEMAKLLDITKPVLVYRNLINKVLSVRQGSRVMCHTDYIFLSDVTFKVSDNGREKVRETGQKNVHAFVHGMIASPRLVDNLPTIGDATYDPYLYDSFMLIDHDGKLSPIHKALYADISSTGSIIVW